MVYTLFFYTVPVLYSTSFPAWHYKGHIFLLIKYLKHNSEGLLSIDQINIHLAIILIIECISCFQFFFHCYK